MGKYIADASPDIKAQNALSLFAMVTELPVRAYADRIVEAVRDNKFTVIIGETGSGKTTQIAQVCYTKCLAGLTTTWQTHGLLCLWCTL